MIVVRDFSDISDNPCAVQAFIQQAMWNGCDVYSINEQCTGRQFAGAWEIVNNGKFDKRIISSGTLVFEKGKKPAKEFATEKEADEYIEERQKEDKKSE